MKKDTLVQIIGLGIISGMRATFASTFVAHFLSKKQSTALSESKLAFIQSPKAAVVTKLLSAGEIIGDKLPNTPNRISAPQVIARIAAGAFAGAVVSTANDFDRETGVLVGGATALASTFGTFYLRQFVDKSTFLKEPVTGAVEDVIAITGGVLLMQSS